MRARRIASCVALLVALTLSVTAAAPAVMAHDDDVPPGFEAIDAFIQSELDDSRIPGAAVAVVQGGETIYAQGFGTDDGYGISARTAFPIGSLTKSFTALAVMQRVEAGQLELDAPVQRYLPWFTLADAEAAARITVRMLLNQTSGISRETGIIPIRDEWDGTAEEYVRALATTELNRPAGETYEYSNANFVILGLLIETVSGQPYGDYVREHIFEPLGMVDSFVSLKEGRRAGMVDLHHFMFGVPVETTAAHLPGQIAAGYLVSSAEDMARYLTLYLNDGMYNGRQILSPEGIATLLEPATNEFSSTLLGTTFEARYGMGWFAGAFGAQEDARWHMGQLPMFNAWMVIMPESEQAMVLLVNANSALPLPGATEVFSRIPVGVVNMLAGEDAPSGTSLTRFYLFFNIIAIGIVAVQVAALVRLAMRQRPALTGVLRRARYTVPLVWELGLSLLLLLGLPLLLGVGWGVSFSAMPDLTLVVAIVATLWLATGLVRVVRVVAPIRARRAPRRSLEEAGVPAS